MRHLFIILLLTFGLFGVAFSDAGNCVKYDVDVQLISGQKIRGFVFVGGYEKKFQFQDISFLDYVKKNNPSDTLHIFKNIQQLRFPTTNVGIEKCKFHFDATTADNEIKILKNRVNTIKVVSYSVCNNCDIANETTGYYWNGIYPTVITELTKTEIDLLQTQPIATVHFGHDFKNNTVEYWIISYSSEYTQSDLEKLKNDYLIEADKLLRENKSDIVQSKYKVIKSDFRKRKIIFFKIEQAL